MTASICIEFFLHEIPNSRPQVGWEKEDLLNTAVEIFEVFLAFDHGSQTDFIGVSTNRVYDMEAAKTGLDVWENGFNSVEDSLFAVRMAVGEVKGLSILLTHIANQLEDIAVGGFEFIG